MPLSVALSSALALAADGLDAFDDRPLSLASIEIDFLQEKAEDHWQRQEQDQHDTR